LSRACDGALVRDKCRKLTCHCAPPIHEPETNGRGAKLDGIPALTAGQDELDPSVAIPVADEFDERPNFPLLLG
jgi:hypothetical protein